MGLQKNVASQKWRVFAFDRTDGTPKTGDATQITAKIDLDWAGAGATDDVNPTEVEDGYYLFDLTQAETNADVVDLMPESSTGDIQVIGVPGTIYTVSPNFKAQYDGTGLAGGTFPATQDQLSGLANVGSAVHIASKPSPNGFVITTGDTEVNTENSTAALDGTVHSINDTGGTLDVYYEFAVGGGIPASVQVTGFMRGNNDDLNVHGYDWILDDWVQIGEWEGRVASSNEIKIFNMFTAMVGFGDDHGTARIRFEGTGLTSATMSIDQIFIAFSLGSGDYANGAIWIDTGASNTNTVPGVDGTSTNPVSTIVAANTLAAELNLNRFQIAPGSSITFAASQTGQVFVGESWTLALGGQDIAGTHIIGAAVSGVASGTGTTQVYRQCLMNATSHIKGTHITESAIDATQTAAEAGEFYLDRCHSGIAGAATWIWDFGTSIGNTNLHVRSYSGGIQLEAMGNTGTDTASIEGWGQVIEGTCAGGTVSIRGTFTLSGITNLTLSDDARIDMAQINAEVDTALVDINLDHLLKVAVTGADVVDDTVFARLVSKEATADWDDFDNTTDALQALRDLIGTAGAGLTDLGGMSTGMRAEVNVEAKDVLVTDALAEITSVPAANASIAAKGNWVFAILTNELNQTEDTTTLRNRADDADIATSAISDDAVTFVSGVWE